MKRTFRRLASLLLGFLPLATGAVAATPAVRNVSPEFSKVLVAANAQPTEFGYTAFPSLIQIGPDEVWIAYKVGRSHATDAGAAIEVRSLVLSTGQTALLQRLVAPAPKLYQMGELVQFPDKSIGLYIDVQVVGWDGRHSRGGAESFRWNPPRRAFDGPTPLAPVGGVLYGYPFDFVSNGNTTWQLIMAFGYHLPGGRWSVDALRTNNHGASWHFVKNLTEEFGGIRANESGFSRYKDGFIIATRGYDRTARLHRTDREFNVKQEVTLTGKYPFIQGHVGRPRIFMRDGQGYLIGRNSTRPPSDAGKKSGAPSEMQLCLFRFDPETLEVTSCVVLDNADHQRVSDGYYAVVAFTGERDNARLHVITYKGLNGRPPDIVRLDYRWEGVR